MGFQERLGLARASPPLRIRSNGLEGALRWTLRSSEWNLTLSLSRCGASLAFGHVHDLQDQRQVNECPSGLPVRSGEPPLPFSFLTMCPFLGDEKPDSSQPGLPWWSPSSSPSVPCPHSASVFLHSVMSSIMGPGNVSSHTGWVSSRVGMEKAVIHPEGWIWKSQKGPTQGRSLLGLHGSSFPGLWGLRALGATPYGNWLSGSSERLRGGRLGTWHLPLPSPESLRP